jgi:hypothetical protein
LASSYRVKQRVGRGSTLLVRHLSPYSEWTVISYIYTDLTIPEYLKSISDEEFPRAHARIAEAYMNYLASPHGMRFVEEVELPMGIPNRDPERIFMQYVGKNWAIHAREGMDDELAYFLIGRLRNKTTRRCLPFLAHV